ncbi:MAG: hypothetical protein KDJ75_07315 [Alphaproteobacteria bacterium]|nr:hypothetical protein [Alphaproteobacteria bacterium]
MTTIIGLYTDEQSQEFMSRLYPIHTLFVKCARLSTRDHLTVDLAPFTYEGDSLQATGFDTSRAFGKIWSTDVKPEKEKNRDEACPDPLAGGAEINAEKGELSIVFLRQSNREGITNLTCDGGALIRKIAFSEKHEPLLDEDGRVLAQHLGFVPQGKTGVLMMGHLAQMMGQGDPYFEVK